MEYTKWKSHEKKKQTGRECETEYAIRFKELGPHHMQTRMKEKPEYNSIINYPLKLIDAIAQSVHGTIRTTYSYL